MDNAGNYRPLGSTKRSFDKRKWNKGARRYEHIDGSGKTISRRQYQNFLARAVGFDSYSQYQRMPLSRKHRRRLELAAETHGTSITVQRRITSQFNRLLGKARRERILARVEGREEDLSPDGPLAEYLVFLGLRETQWDWAVGESPPRKT